MKAGHLLALHRHNSRKDDFVIFFALDWCGPCKLMSPIFKALSEEVTDVEFVKVNTDLHEDKIDGFNIQGLPLFGVFLKGKMVSSFFRLGLKATSII
jgi:thiol-disulfide isomerase/thioredoxin